MFKKKLLAFALAGTMVFSLAACGDADSSSDTASSDTQTKSDAQETGEEETEEAEEVDTGELKAIRIGLAGSEDTALGIELMAVAYREGYLEEELNAKGYTAEAIQFAGGGPEINEAFASSDLDVAVYGDLPLFTSNGNGIKSTVIANVNTEVQYGLLTVSDDIQEPKDLEGKRVTIAEGTVIQYFWDDYVEENDLDLSTIEVVNSTDASSLLATGEVDAAPNMLYYALSLEASGIGKVFQTSSDCENASSVVCVTVRDKYLEENPDAAVAIDIALLRAFDAIVADPQMLYDDEEGANMPAEIWEQVYAYDTSFGYMYPEITDELIAYFDTFNDWMIDNGLIASPVDVDSLYDTSYFEQALAEYNS